MKHIKTLVVAIAGLVLATASSHATLLSDLIGQNGSLQVGDKIFANFTWSGPTGPAGITIDGLGTGVGLDYYGIEIGGGLSQVGLGISDWRLGYSVTVAPNAGYLISDIHQYANFNGSAGSLVNVSEDILNGNGGGAQVVASSHVGVGINFAFLDQTDPDAELNDILVLGTPLNQVWIKKDIHLQTFGQNDSVFLSIIDQRFSQVAVPEATTLIAGALLILPFGASALRILRKNRTA